MENEPLNSPDSLGKDQDKDTNNQGEKEDQDDLSKFKVNIDLNATEEIPHDDNGPTDEHQPDTETKEITADVLLSEKVEEMKFIVQGLLQQVGLACLAGSSDTGKSALLRQLSIAIATGANEFLGFRLNFVHRSVVFVPTEDLKEDTRYLLSRQSKAYKKEQLKGLRFIFDINNLYDDLDKSLTAKPADLVVIDCFSDAFGGDLKDTQKIRTYLHRFQELAQKHKCLILFLHHTSKKTEYNEPNKNNLLSGQGFEAKMRLVIELRADPSDPNQRHLCIVKGNYLPGKDKRESYVLNFNEDTFTFSNTNERMPFEFLAKQTESDNGKAKYEQAVELKNKGLNYDQIAEKLGFKSKGSVTKLFNKAEKYGWGKEN